jgi:hypothetical protein
LCRLSARRPLVSSAGLRFAGLASMPFSKDGSTGHMNRTAEFPIVVLDACRADHVGCYGYERNTTPNLDALRREQLEALGYF